MWHSGYGRRWFFAATQSADLTPKKIGSRLERCLQADATSALSSMHPPLADVCVSLGKALTVDGGGATRWILLISAMTTMVAHQKEAVVLVGLCGAAAGSLRIMVATKRSS